MACSLERLGKVFPYFHSIQSFLFDKKTLKYQQHELGKVDHAPSSFTRELAHAYSWQRITVDSG